MSSILKAVVNDKQQLEEELRGLHTASLSATAEDQQSKGNSNDDALPLIVRQQVPNNGDYVASAGIIWYANLQLVMIILFNNSI